MAEQTAEEAAHEYSRAVINGDIGTSLRKMTPDAFGQTMEIGNQTWEFSAYEITAHNVEGADHLFDITYRSYEGDLHMRQRFQQVDGAWLLVEVKEIE